MTMRTAALSRAAEPTIFNSGGNADLSRWLKTLGKLPADFDGEKLLPLLSHRSERVRVLEATINCQ